MTRGFVLFVVIQFVMYTTIVLNAVNILNGEVAFIKKLMQWLE